jgi:hypothetical protein
MVFCAHLLFVFMASFIFGVLGVIKRFGLRQGKKRKSVFFLPATGINTSFFFIHSFPFLLPLFAVIFPSVVSFVLGILYLSLGSFLSGGGTG